MSIWIGEFIGLKEEMFDDSADKCFYLRLCSAGLVWKGSCLSTKTCKTKALVFLDLRPLSGHLI